MKKLFSPKSIIVAVLGSIIIFQQCGNKNKDIETIKVDGKEYELLSQKIDTVVVEKEVKVTEYVPRTVYRTDTVKVTIPADVDTTAILEDYFASYTILDTLRLDYDFPDGVTTENGTQPSTLGFGVLTDVVSQNRIQSRKVDWTFQIPTIYNTTIVRDLPKTELYWGVGAGLDKTNLFNNVGGSLLLKTKSQHIYELEIGVAAQGGQYGPVIGVGTYWKLFPRK